MSQAHDPVDQPGLALTLSIGAFQVVALFDASGPFFLTADEAFPTATPADWTRAEDLDPDAFGPDGGWNLDFRCYAVRRPDGRVVLVDTGVGRADSPAATWAPTPGHLPQRLQAAGIAAVDVDIVVLTHLHSDHIGWSVGADGTPTFPGARYVVQREELAELSAANDEYLVKPLRRTGQLDEIDGRARLVGAAAGRDDGVTAIPTPGHTPGHQSVLVEGGGRQLVVTGDVLVHAVQLVNPGVAYRFEDDPVTARRSRESVLADARVRTATLATPHLRQPFLAPYPEAG
jgi:glyoxylase-like metal-dependent hydrolase (beta-lactamase superfamily II)